MYSTLYIRTLQGVLITSLCSLSGLSERVSYSDYATGCKIIGFGPQQRPAIFLFSEMSRQVVGPPSLLLKGYGDSSLGVKWLGCGVDHSSPFSGQG